MQAVKHQFYNVVRLTVPKSYKGCRVDIFLLDSVEGLQPADVAEAAANNKLLVNNSFTSTNAIIKSADQVVALLQYRSVPKATPEALHLNIVHEDADLLVLNKAAGMAVHPGPGNRRGTLLNALLYRYGQLPLLKVYNAKPGIVHRLDKYTSGLLVVAKTESAANSLMQQFYEHTIQREYLAIACGRLSKTPLRVKNKISRDPNGQGNRIVVADDDFGKQAVSHFAELIYSKGFSYLSCRLGTGQTHQIRVHLRHLGLPLLADSRYTTTEAQSLQTTAFGKQIGSCISRQALHAASLAFHHPVTQKKMAFTLSPPADFQAALRLLKR